MQSGSFLGVWSFIFELASVAFDPKINVAFDALRSGGNHSVLDLLQTCSSNSTNLIGPFIQNLNKSVFANDRLTNDEQLKVTFEQINSFFEQHPSIKSDCQSEQLENGLDLNDFLAIGQTFKQCSEVEALFKGDQTELVSALVTYLINNSQLSENAEFETKSTILEEFVDRLCLFFQNETSVHKRLQFAATLLERMKEADRALIKNVPIDQWGIVDNLVKVNAIFTYHGWHKLNDTVKCEKVLEFVKINSTNTTLLLESLDAALQQWSRLERQNFKVFYDQIQQHVFASDWHLAEKVLRISKTVRFYEDQDNQMEKKLLETKLSNWGNLNEFCECVGI
ncbi:hypothetical protein M3Y97_00529700 [Aphelenchoides bicaudatus]|nr:hypothetical protein M3Y97_00529700 [Aphelenchoides bicaudatus]